MLVLNHQDGKLSFKFEEGGFAVVDSKLYLSIETKAIDEDAYPDRFLFALEGLVLKNGLESTHFEISINPDYEPPNVHVYTT